MFLVILILIAAFLTAAFVGMVYAAMIMAVLVAFVLFNVYVLLSTLAVMARAAWIEFIRKEPCR